MRIPHVTPFGLRYSPLFTSLLFLFTTALAINTSRVRGKLKIWAGDGGNDELRRATRAHGLSVEHGILSAVLLILLEWQRTPSWAVVALGILVLAARAAHAGGGIAKERQVASAGAGATYVAELVLGLWVLLNAIRAL